MFLNRSGFWVALIASYFGGMHLHPAIARATTAMYPPLAPGSQVLISQGGGQPFEYDDFNFWAEQCLSLSQELDHQKTLETCEQAIMMRPDDANFDLWFARSRALYDLQQYAEAIASFEQILVLAPRDSIAIAYQCAAYGQMQRYQQAIDTCEAALRINGNWGDRSPAFAWYHRGLALQQTGRLETAFESFRRAVENQPEAPIYTANFCALAVELGQFSDCFLGQAIAAYERAIALQPEDANLWLQQGLALEQLGDYERALAAYEQAVALTPDDSFSLAHQCAVLNQLQDYEAAAAACEAALKGNHHWGRGSAAYGWVQTSRTLIGQEDYQAALAAANRAIDIDDRYAPGYTNKAVSLWFLGQSEENNQYYQEAVYAIQQARNLFYSQARNELTETFNRDYPEAPLFAYRGEILAAYNQGRILTSMEEYGGAINAYRYALNLDYQKQQEFQAALAAPTSLALLKDSPPASADTVEFMSPANRAALLTNLAIAFLQTGQPEAALSVAVRAVNADPTSFTAQYNLGLVALRAGQPNTAFQAYSRANELSPNNVYVLTGQGMALAQIGGCQQVALLFFEQALNLAPGYALAETQRELLLDQVSPPASNPPSPRPSAQGNTCPMSQP